MRCRRLWKSRRVRTVFQRHSLHGTGAGGRRGRLLKARLRRVKTRLSLSRGIDFRRARRWRNLLTRSKASRKTPGRPCRLADALSRRTGAGCSCRATRRRCRRRRGGRRWLCRAGRRAWMRLVGVGMPERTSKPVVSSMIRPEWESRTLRVDGGAALKVSLRPTARSAPEARASKIAALL